MEVYCSDLLISFIVSKNFIHCDLRYVTVIFLCRFAEAEKPAAASSPGETEKLQQAAEAESKLISAEKQKEQEKLAEVRSNASPRA